MKNYFCHHQSGILPFRFIYFWVALIFPLNLYASGSEGVFLNAGFYYLGGSFSDQYNDGRTNTFQETLVNASLGYGLGSGLVLGIKYYEEGKKDYDASGGLALHEKTTALGFGAGFMSQGLFAFLSLYPLNAPEKTLKSQQITYSAGSGKSLDVAYLVDVGGISFGPQISYFVFDYKKIEIRGANYQRTSFELSESVLRPLLAFMVNF